MCVMYGLVNPYVSSSLCTTERRRRNFVPLLIFFFFSPLLALKLDRRLYRIPFLGLGLKLLAPPWISKIRDGQ